MIFDDLTPEEMQAVEKLAKVRVYRQGSLIIEEGKAGVSFFLMLSGRVEIRKRIAGGQYKKLIELGPCGVFGEVAFLGVESRSASVIALRDCEVLEFDGKETKRFMNEKPAIGLKLYRGMARELARRLAKSDEDIKDAIVWAMIDPKDKVHPVGDNIDVPARPKLTLDPRRAPPADREPIL
ncbi:MAG: cyclic nucleotide-binding domain-containing protein [Kiritimatiellae bacterium]|nr:cyclic nucleotide-binding domain-containing protein [Kiritimatiellia bacterium]